MSPWPGVNYCQRPSRLALASQWAPSVLSARTSVSPANRRARSVHNAVRIPIRRGVGNHPRIAHPPRRTKPLGRRTGDSADRFVTSLHFLSDLRGRTPEKICMRGGVVADGMSANGNFANQLRTFLSESPHHKKGGACLITLSEASTVRE